jgi:hypothetical protein
MRFNPAPGWPPPPSAYWLPPADWRPDPSWPPAPPGWQYIVQEGQQPSAPRPERTPPVQPSWPAQPQAGGADLPVTLAVADGTLRTGSASSRGKWRSWSTVRKMWVGSAVVGLVLSLGVVAAAAGGAFSGVDPQTTPYSNGYYEGEDIPAGYTDAQMDETCKESAEEFASTRAAETGLSTSEQKLSALAFEVGCSSGFEDSR